MSSDYIFECAKNFEQLYSKTNERLQLIQNKSNIKDDLVQIKGYLTEMENMLNSIELDSSLIDSKNPNSHEKQILQSCRTHFNEIRKKFHSAENQYFSNNEQKNMQSFESSQQNGYNQTSNIQNIFMKYGADFPLDSSIIPDQLRILRHRQVLKKRAILALILLSVLFILYRIIF